MANRVDMALRLAKEGRTEGYKYLYDDTIDRQLEKAITLTEDMTQAHMAVQQAYQYVFDQIAQVPEGTVFENWLSDMISYFSVMVMRGERPDGFADAETLTYRLEEEDMSIIEPIDETEVSEVYTPDEITDMVTQILAELTEAEKICVIMHYQDKQSVAQVAQTVGCTEQVAESLIASGKKKILDATSRLADADDRERWSPIPFILALLRLKASNLIASGIAGTMATFQIAGNAVTFGASGIAGGAAGAGAVAAGNGASGAGTAIGSGTAAGSGAAGAGTAAGHGFSHTLAAKILVGVAATAVVGGTAAGIIAYNHSQKNQGDTATNTDAVAASTMEAASEETTTEEVTTEEAVNEEYKRAYLTVLKDNETNIRAYESGMSIYGAMDGQDVNAKKAVAIEDITGDGVPELIYMTWMQYDGNLNIYTCQDGKVKQLYAKDNWDIQAGGGARYYLFKINGDDRLYYYYELGDMSWTTDICRFDEQTDGTLTVVTVAECYETPNEDDTQTITTYTVDGQTVDANTYNKKMDELKNGREKLLLRNLSGEELGTTPQEALSYDEAIALLSGGQQAQAETSGSDTSTLPFTTAQTLQWWESLRSGTSITINPDGTFTGEYSGHASTRMEGWECDFHGSFKNVMKKNDYTFTMELDTLEYDTPQSEWTQNGRHYESSEAYGVMDGKTFELYLPGTAVSALPQTFLDDVKRLNAGYNETALSGYGMYNVDGQHAYLIKQ